MQLLEFEIKAFDNNLFRIFVWFIKLKYKINP